MEKKTFIYLGLIGGILAAVGVFLEWASISVNIPGVFTYSASASGWDATAGMAAPYLALAGGILALLGGLGLLMGKRGLGFLLPIGGILAIAGSAWAFVDINAAIAGVAAVIVQIEALGGSASVGVGYGLYLSIVGGVMALIGSLGLKGK